VVDSQDIYWVEGRPEEGGRNVVVRRSPDGRVTDVTPRDTNARTRVHEYGGAVYAVSDGIVYFAEFADQRLYRLEPGGVPEALTSGTACFYADAAVDRQRRRLVCVREDHRQADREATTTLVSVSFDVADGAERLEPKVLVSGHDFYSTPRLSPDGSRLLWLAWRHPQMPWDGTELWVGDVTAEGGIEGAHAVAGGNEESIFQPGWSPDGEVYFVSDRSGWWNLYRLRERGAKSDVESVCPMAAEFGRPQWQLGTSTWAFAGSSRLVTACAERGRWRLITLDLAADRTVLTSRNVPTDLEPGESVATSPTHAVLIAGSVQEPDAIVQVHLETGVVDTIRRASSVKVDRGCFAAPEAIEFPTDEKLTAYAFYYAPTNADFTGPDGERPPLIVIAHGGPTAAANARLNLEVQYFTSRGFAVADINYGGSTNHGRAYRRRLRGQWGVVDVADCINAAKYLVAGGRADPDRLVIRGRSAGGYTTLAALTFQPGVFKAGASYYGIGDLERLAQETHKFESRYLDGLIGPYPAARALYRARSPIDHVDRLSSALVLYQGMEDRVVPPDQARAMAEAVRVKGLPVALYTFEGEQHGFRKASSIVRCLETELAFYRSVFGFTPADGSL
jgi:dipeptidyl aminopeptidase/acylaminoacyl peptidase